MAYISEEKTKEIGKEIIRKFPRRDGWKIDVSNNKLTMIVISIFEGPIDLPRYTKGSFLKEGYYMINYHLINDEWSGRGKEIMDIICKIATEDMGNDFDNSWYVSINIGSWEKPFQVFIK